MRGPGWHVDGVDEDRFLGMLYSEPAEAIIAHFERGYAAAAARRCMTGGTLQVPLSHASWQSGA